ncbi:hypothetical protein [Streptomyces sp. NRRL S-920]|uniref:hypothetical protein n=1 Tax=Streptomyces sp. NRRL S-920 TaxID=1463921 RepID=UPI00131DB269|nr:hypothetical protein [Streptomyces sp. NRRL S-920]
MTTPSDPGETVPAEPPVSPDEAAVQGAAAEAEAAAAAQLNAIRELAAEIAKQTLLAFDPATLRKGTVSSIASAAAPPTLGVQISGDTTEIPGVRYIDSYAPEVGDTVLIIKQGTDLVALGEIAGQFSESGWTTVPLAAGFTHNGNSNGNVEVRRIWDHGSWKVQFKGAANRSSGTVVCTDLGEKYRPTARRSLLVTRTANGGSNVVKVDIETSGSVTMVGGTTAPNGGDTSTSSEHTHQIANSDHFHGDTSSEGSHTHGIANNDHNHGGDTGTTSSHKHSIPTTTHKHGNPADGEPGGTTSVNDHAHSIPTSSHTHGTNGALADGSHDHTFTPVVEDPAWISFNQLEYFL